MESMKKTECNIAVHNDINTVPLRRFTSIELDLLFTILSQMRDKGITEVTYSFEELKELSNYDLTKGIDRFVQDLERTYDKLISLNVKIGTSRDWTKFVFFTKYSISIDKRIISIATNVEFAHLINRLTNNFTKFELDEFLSLKGSYSKTAYRLLKQFRSTGYCVFTMDKFRELFCIPKSYKMGDIDKRVLNPIYEDIRSYFSDFYIEKISKEKGRKITHIEFTFSPQDDVKDGKKIFRSKDGNYYQKHLEGFTEEEVHKTFPPVPQPMAEKYDKQSLEEKKEYIFFCLEMAETTEQRREIIEKNQEDIKQLCKAKLAKITDFI